MPVAMRAGPWQIRRVGQITEATDGLLISDEEVIVCRGEPAAAELSRIVYASGVERWVVREPARRAYRIGLVQSGIAIACAPDYSLVEDDEVEPPPLPPSALKLFSLEGESQQAFEIDDLSALATNPQSSEVYAGTGGGDLVVASQGRDIGRLAQVEGSIDSLQLSQDCNWLAAGEWSGRVRVVNLKTNPTEHTNLRAAGAGSGIAFASAPDELIAAADNGLSIFDLRQGRQVAALQNTLAPLPDTISEISVAADGRSILTGTQGTGWVSLWDVETKSLRAHIFKHPDHILRVAFSPSSQYFLVVVEGLLQIYSLARV